MQIGSNVARQPSSPTCELAVISSQPSSDSQEADGGKELGNGGTITLSVDGNMVGSGKVDQTTPFKYFIVGKPRHRTGHRYRRR
jgi:hypothetical protein